MKLDKSYANDVSFLLKDIEVNEADNLELFRVLANLRKTAYDCYIEAGFSEDQSIKLVQAEIQKSYP